MILTQIIFYLVVIGLAVGTIYYLYQSKIKQEIRSWYTNKKIVVLSILVPKENEKKPVAAEQMFASLHGIFRAENRYQDLISFEIVSKDKYIQFYVALPDYLKDFVEGQIYAQYPDVEIFEVPDYTQQSLSGYHIASTQMKLAKNEVYPIKTFANFEVDPLAAITGVFSKINEGEQIWMQMIIKPVSDAWQIRGVSHVSAMRAGKSNVAGNSFFANMLDFFVSLFKDALKSFLNPTQADSGSSGGEVKLSGPEEEALKETERKSTKLGFATKIRLIVLSKDKITARSKIASIAGAFKQFSTTNLNTIVNGKITNNLKALENYKQRKFYDNGYILNIEELASLYHLPTKSVETPNIVWAGSKKGEPPSNLPVVGSVEDRELTLLAKTNFRNFEKKFGIKRRDRSLHMYVVGKTGTGKSTLMENMVIDDIKKGQGVAYIDPHGDAIEHIMQHIPKDRINDVIYFNPSDKEFPIGFNPLESVDPELKNIVASGVVGIFKKIFGESWGPRLEYILRNALLAAVDYPDSTLLSVMRLLTDKVYRGKVISSISDPVVKDFFNNEYDKYDPRFQREAIAPIQNKVGQFLSSSTIRNIVGQPKSTIDLNEIMNTKKIFLVDLSVGKIGEDNSALLGSMLITKFQLAAMQRARIPAEQRKDFYLYVDEFQNFATDSFSVILSEARKYKLNLTMTNQYIAQMPETVAKAIFGNVGTIISFRVGATDASGLVKEFEPVFTANDLVNLNNYNIYLKMAIDGVTRPAFSAITLAPPEPISVGIRDKIIYSSRERYARPKEFVEDKIAKWNNELEQAHAKQKNEEEFRKNFLKPKGDKIKTISEKKSDNYYTFVDKKGEKWYIPNFPKEITEKPVENKKISVLDKKIVKNNKPKISKNDISSENKKEVTREKVKKFKPIIESQLDKNLNKVKDNISNDNISDDALMSLEELENFLKDK